MPINEEVVKSLLILKNAFKSSEFDIDTFTSLLKEEAKKLNLESSELLQLFFNKEYLIVNVSQTTKDIDEKIAELEAKIKELESLKYKLGSAICELYGHRFKYNALEKTQFCLNCGREIQLESSLQYLKDRDSKEAAIYRK